MGQADSTPAVYEQHRLPALLIMAYVCSEKKKKVLSHALPCSLPTLLYVVTYFNLTPVNTEFVMHMHSPTLTQ